MVTGNRYFLSFLLPVTIHLERFIYKYVYRCFMAKKTFKKLVSIFEEDEILLNEINSKCNSITERNFNLSKFVRKCLRNSKLVEEFIEEMREC